jgi:hypothetical protein
MEQKLGWIKKIVEKMEEAAQENHQKYLEAVAQEFEKLSLQLAEDAKKLRALAKQSLFEEASAQPNLPRSRIKRKRDQSLLSDLERQVLVFHFKEHTNPLEIAKKIYPEKASILTHSSKSGETEGFKLYRRVVNARFRALRKLSQIGPDQVNNLLPEEKDLYFAHQKSR